jgi:hypothetical protein
LKFRVQSLRSGVSGVRGSTWGTVRPMSRIGTVSHSMTNLKSFTGGLVLVAGPVFRV